MTNHSDEKQKRREAANQLVQQVLSNIPSIKFLGFHDLKIMDYTPSPNEFPERWHELSASPSHDDKEVIAWIKSVLKSEQVSGQYFLIFRDIERNTDSSWAAVEINQDYDWVEPIWLRGRMMQIWSGDKTHSYMFIAEEGKWRAYKIQMLPNPRPWRREEK